MAGGHPTTLTGGEAGHPTLHNNLGRDVNRIMVGPTCIDVGGHTGMVIDGSADTRAALEGCWSTYGQGKVYNYGSADLLINSGTGLSPPAYSLHRGAHKPRYHVADDLPTAATRIRIGSSFAGTALIKAADGNVKGVGFEDIALAGMGLNNASAGAVNGMQWPTLAQDNGETHWSLRDVSIAGFTGSGITGRIWTATFHGVHITACRGWAVTPGTGNRFNDTFWTDCFLYFNRSGNLWLGESGNNQTNGYNNFGNCRFERGGGNVASVGSPFNANAPGIRITNAVQTQMANCNTDANTGCGLDMTAPVAGMAGKYLYSVFTNCVFARDGYADAVTAGDMAGVKVKGFSATTGTDGVNLVSFSNTGVLVGKPDDAGVIGPLAPKYGAWLENAEYLSFDGAPVDGATTDVYFGTGGAGTLWKPKLNIYYRLIHTVPTFTTATRPAGPAGMHGFDTTIGKPVWFNGSVWKDATGTTV